MRLALARAAEVLGRHHPLAAASFRTDGRRIFLEIADRFGYLKIDGSGYQKFHYLLLVKRQSNR